jgi:hypothetical protein
VGHGAAKGSTSLVPYPMGSSGANGANGTNGANGAVSNPGTGARTGKPRIQSVSQYPIDLIHLGSPAQLRAGHRIGQGTKPLISPCKGFVVVRA